MLISFKINGDESQILNLGHFPTILIIAPTFTPAASFIDCQTYPTKVGSAKRALHMFAGLFVLEDHRAVRTSPILRSQVCGLYSCLFVFELELFVAGALCQVFF
jgi:hypothetical protein